MPGLGLRAWRQHFVVRRNAFKRAVSARRGLTSQFVAAFELRACECVRLLPSGARRAGFCPAGVPAAGCLVQSWYAGNLRSRPHTCMSRMFRARVLIRIGMCKGSVHLGAGCIARW